MRRRWLCVPQNAVDGDPRDRAVDLPVRDQRVVQAGVQHSASCMQQLGGKRAPRDSVELDKGAVDVGSSSAAGRERGRRGLVRPVGKRARASGWMGALNTGASREEPGSRCGSEFAGCGW